MEVLPTIPRVAAVNLRRSVIIASVVGVIAVVLTSLIGHPLMGVFACLGIAMGALNSWLVQRSVVAFASSDVPNKKALFTKNVLGRLAVITLISVGIAMFIRPDGLGTFAGLAFFQMLMLGGASVPVFRQLKQETS